ncbi:hypothetical protein BDV93DRAFT_525167 [Ceratobasidium sp. AG-I]|nr:hypothetical protein BDV93DRAFT_525167 [Ceratobasidium sp. AG-I]
MCSKLQSLYLINGRISEKVARIVVEAHPLQSLTFGTCWPNQRGSLSVESST